MKLSELDKNELDSVMSRLLIYAKSLTKYLGDAQELTQATLLKALEREEKQFDGKHLRAWLRKIMLNTFKDQLRKKKPNTFTDSNIENPTINDQSASAETESILTDLENCLENYPEREKEIIRLIGQEYTPDEIAEDMGLSAGNVRQIMFRKRPELAECLEGRAA